MPTAAVAGDPPLAPEKKLLGAGEFAGWLRDYWPNFVYFEAFQDSLPRQVDVAAVQSALSPVSDEDTKVLSSVLDFVELAGLDVERVAGLADNDKALENYLSQRGAAITGDFLSYWII